MEFNLHSKSSSLCLLLFFAISSTVFINHASASENVTNPRRNDNMGLTQGWRSAVECMMYNKSIWCNEKQQLSLNLTIEVAQEEMGNYCRNGCLQHTLGVLDCIRDVKRDFSFANDFDTWTLRAFLTDRCSTSNLTGFSYKDIRSSGAFEVSRKMGLSIIVSLLALAYIERLHHIM